MRRGEQREGRTRESLLSLERKKSFVFVVTVAVAAKNSWRIPEGVGVDVLKIFDWRCTLFPDVNAESSKAD